MSQLLSHKTEDLLLKWNATVNGMVPFAIETVTKWLSRSSAGQRTFFK